MAIAPAQSSPDFTSELACDAAFAEPVPVIPKSDLLFRDLLDEDNSHLEDHLGSWPLADTMDSSPLAKLAGELRNRIYALVLSLPEGISVLDDHNDDTPHTRTEDRNPPHLLALTSTCWKIREESIPVLLNENSLTVHYIYDNQTRSSSPQLQLRTPHPSMSRNVFERNTNLSNHMLVIQQIESRQQAQKLLTWMKTFGPALPKSWPVTFDLGVHVQRPQVAWLKAMAEALHSTNLHLALVVHFHYDWPVQDQEGAATKTVWQTRCLKYDFLQNSPAQIRKSLAAHASRTQAESRRGFVETAFADRLAQRLGRDDRPRLPHFASYATQRWSLVSVQSDLKSHSEKLKSVLGQKWEAIDNKQGAEGTNSLNDGEARPAMQQCV